LLAAFALRFAPRWTEPSYCGVIVAGLCWLTLPAALGWNEAVVPSPTLGGPIDGAAMASFWAIAGGLASGFAMAALIALGKIESILLHADAGPIRKPSVEPELEQAIAARAEGRPEDSFELIATLLDRKPEHRAGLLAMWDVALELGRTANASRAMLRVIREEVRRNAPAAVEHWLDLVSRGLHREAEPALLIHVALMLHAAQRPTEALEALERALEIAPATDSTQVATRVARASRALDPNLMAAAAWRALGSIDLALQDRQNLEAMLGELYQEGTLPRITSERLGDADAKPHRAVSSSPSETDSRAEDPLLRWEDPELPDEMGLTREEPLTPVAASAGSGDAAEAFASVRPVPIDLELASRELRAVSAQPIELFDDGLVIEVEGGEKRKIAFRRVDALSVVAVDGLGPTFIIVVDLVLNWMSESLEPLKVIRLRGDQFDPRPFAPGMDSPLDAMRAFTSHLLEITKAIALPDVQSVRGSPFASFADLASYHRTVFSVEQPPADLISRT
jgi:tetratricopeptide (TPR) repeat protein